MTICCILYVANEKYSDCFGGMGEGTFVCLWKTFLLLYETFFLVPNKLTETH